MSYYTLHVSSGILPSTRFPTIPGNWKVFGWYKTGIEAQDAQRRLAKEPNELKRWMIWYHQNQTGEGILIHSDGAFAPAFSSTET